MVMMIRSKGTIIVGLCMIGTVSVKGGCPTYTNCADCLSPDNGLDCGWCSPDPAVHGNGTEDIQCMDHALLGFNCFNLYMYDGCVQGYTCDTTNNQCTLANPGEGDTYDNCIELCSDKGLNSELEYIRHTVDIDEFVSDTGPDVKLNLATLTQTQGFAMSGAPVNSGTGSSVSRVGDMNKDGIDDIIIAGYYANDNSGVSYVIFGGTALSDINLGSMTTSQGFSIYGAPDNSYSGRSVSAAGDVNNDGYDDVIIGAGWANDGTGICYVVYGGPALTDIDLSSMTASQGFSIYGTLLRGYTGWSVSGAGDMNNDGYDDVVIGAPEGDEFSVSYVIFGAASLSDLYLTNLTASEGFAMVGPGTSGESVSGAGDVNNDGYDDVLIGAAAPGFCYVIYGCNALGDLFLANMTLSQGFSIYRTPETSAHDGWAVSGAGDVNNDGYDDIIIGSETNSLADFCYVVYGGMSLTHTDLTNITTSQGFSIFYDTASMTQFGFAVSGAGDINNDGYDDVIIGVGWANDYAGMSYVVYGGISLNNIILTKMTASQGFTVYGASANSLSGFSVSGAGDINKDGYDDVIIGSHDDNDEAESFISCYVVYGAASGFNTFSPTLAPAFVPTLSLKDKSSISLFALSSYQGISINGEVSSSSGYCVSSAGDINGDGYADFMIGAPGTNNFAGRASIIYGNSNPSSTINLVQMGSEGISISGIIGSYTGNALSKVGDMNGDGYDDFAVCAPDIGVAYMIYGSASPSTISLTDLVSRQGLSIFDLSTTTGYSVSGAGDINNDGIDDFIIESTITYVIYGGIALCNIDLDNITAYQGFAIYNAPGVLHGGCAAAGAGDMNNDGYDDVIISSSETNDDHAEVGVYIVFGGPALNDTYLYNMTASQGFSMIGTANKYGVAVSGAGDVNNDGYDDVIIGSFDPSVCYLIYGGMTLSDMDLSNMTSSQGISIVGVYNSGLGSSVSGAGDMNNDGYDDVIIGAPDAGVTNSNNYAGASYVVYGGSGLTNIDLTSMTASQGFSMYDASPNDYFGSIVSGAGDMNNDGYDDVIITAQTSDDSGISYVVFGGSALSDIDSAGTMTASQGFLIYGAPSYSRSGTSVSGAGDINKDGYDDVIIGAPDANANAGISYVVYGGSALTGIDLSSMTTSQGFSIYGPFDASYSGMRVSGAGDVNNDGYDDIIIGTLSVGMSYVVYGGSSLSNIYLANFPTVPQGFSVSGLAPSNDGCNIAQAGDVNNDGYDDIIIGNPSASGGTGKVYIIYGNMNFLSNVDLTILSPASGIGMSGIDIGGYLGRSVSGAGDINKDGYDDVIIGAPYADSQAGKTYIIYGGPSLNNINLANLASSQGFYINSSPENSQCGYSVGEAGDVNNDGYDDVIIGAPYADSQAGKTYIIYGGPSLNNINLASFTLTQGFYIRGSSLSQSGFSVSGAGDVNKDGFEDIVIGAPYADSQTGKTYIIYGGPSLNDINLANLASSQGFCITSVDGYSQSGFSVSGAGDINKDGYDDVLIGAPSTVYGHSVDGAAFIIYGAESGFATLSPTSLPTHLPTPFPVALPSYDDDDDIKESIEFKIGFSLASFLLSALFAWIFRDKIAFYVLNDWGHKYVLHNPYKQLKEDEIGIKLTLSNELICIVKFKDFILLDSDSDNHGISKPLYNVIRQAAENVDHESFTLTQYEQIQIRDYLIVHQYLIPTKTCGCLESYTELGHVKGILYYLLLHSFGAEHLKASKKHVRKHEYIALNKDSNNVDNQDNDDLTTNLIDSYSAEINSEDISSNKPSFADDVSYDALQLTGPADNGDEERGSIGAMGNNSEDILK